LHKNVGIPIDTKRRKKNVLQKTNQLIKQLKNIDV